jgi:pimeloyl-ACP methyl ester carboxylesterase
MHRKIMSAAIVSAALASGADCAPRTRPSFVAHYGTPQTLVPVQGKRRLNLACVGSGKTTVVFLSGLGSGTFDWRKVQPAIGRVTRACAYDRAGYGFSDPATAPLDVTNTIADLHALLHSKAITGPVILVGHSLGGLYAVSYALRYRGDVAGMVLIDPAFGGQTRQIAKAVGPAAAGRLQAANAQTLASLDKCVALAATGRLSLPAEQASDCLDNPPDPDPDIHRERNRAAKSAASQRALRSEFEMANIVGGDGETVDDRQSNRSGSTLGAMPLAILTRGNSEALSGLSADEIAKAERAWRTGHDRLAELSIVGVNTIVPRSGHFIQLDQTEAVIAQVLKMARQVNR